jgi:hypothetical protein
MFFSRLSSDCLVLFSLDSHSGETMWDRFRQHVNAKAFMHTDPKSAKRQLSHLCLFALLGSERIKAAGKMLVKSTHVVGRETFPTRILTII